VSSFCRFVLLGLFRHFPAARMLPPLLLPRRILTLSLMTTISKSRATRRYESDWKSHPFALVPVDYSGCPLFEIVVISDKVRILLARAGGRIACGQQGNAEKASRTNRQNEDTGSPCSYLQQNPD